MTNDLFVTRENSIPTSPLDELLLTLRKDKAIESIISNLREGMRGIRPGLLSGSAKTLLIALLSRELNRPILVITPKPSVSRWFADDLRILIHDTAILELPDTELLPYEESHPDPEITSLRMQALSALSRGDQTITITTASAILCRIPATGWNAASSIRLAPGGEIDYDRLLRSLGDAGYSRVPLVEEIGHFSVRGGVVDFYPPGSQDPIRAEFDGDTVESLRSFRPDTQRSIGPIDEVAVLPRDELVLTNLKNWEGEDKEEELFLRARAHGVSTDQVDRMLLALQHDPLHASRRWLYPLFSINPISILDLVSSETIIYLEDAKSVEEVLLSSYEKVREEYRRRSKIGARVPLLPPNVLFDEPKVLMTRLEADASLISFFEESTGPLEIHRAEPFGGSLKLLRERLLELGEGDFKVWLSCENEGQKDRLEEILGSHPHVRFWVRGVRHGFTWPALKTVVLTDQDIFQRYVHRGRRSRRHHAGHSKGTLLDLKQGAYVVHAFHGIGRFEGLTKVKVQSWEQECLSIAYKGGDRLYVPIEQSNLVERYLGPDSRAPALDSLGGNKWKRKKAKVRKAVEDMAQELLELYAARHATPGYPFPSADHWEEELRASFPFQETPDQTTAWNDIATDMERPKPMDRLVCGDVGYGKTELAVRAAFKTVMSNKQVGVLVPTTILAEQHYNTFRERMVEYPVNIEMLSRFRTRVEQKSIISKLKSGEIDIVIGTHRLLQKDIGFKNLGLIVVDEEQRFGVAHKELLKRLRTEVDVLTMTATPIPRTLHMALLGVRDMSVVNTPPQGRVPIRTRVSTFDGDLVAHAIRREISRGGQVYFVHNRVESILSAAAYLKKILPEITFGVAHGQMNETDLEDIMHRFLARDFDVLVCSMIIESGLDIPGVDTIVINRADRFGLAQLYQLRGRVGRGKRQAFAYLLVPSFRSLTATAGRRLEAMKQFTELGSSLRLSLLDLEIRGVGNILGRDQHGQVADVGFHMYCRMLEKEVKKLKGESQPQIDDLTLHTAVPLGLPDDYIREQSLRMEIYRKFGEIDTLRGLAAVSDEIQDRFGSRPPEVARLLRAAQLKILLLPLLVETVHWTALKLIIRPKAAETLHPKLIALGHRCEGDWRKYGKTSLQLEIALSRSASSGEELDPILEALEAGEKSELTPILLI